MIIPRVRRTYPQLPGNLGAPRTAQFRTWGVERYISIEFGVGIAHFLKLPAIPVVTSMVPRESDNRISARHNEMSAEKIKKDDSDWRKQLTPNQYYVTRQKGTEPPFTGEYEDTTAPGTYKRVCCGQPLFRSEPKCDSGCGWPSFDAPADVAALDNETDRSHGMLRTEVKCSRCDARSEEHTSELQSH